MMFSSVVLAIVIFYSILRFAAWVKYDYFAPRYLHSADILSVIRNPAYDTEDSMGYDITWDVDRTYWLGFLTVEICSPACTAFKVDATARSGKLWIPYYADFKVSVTGHFTRMVRFDVNTASFEGKTPIGQPTEVRNLTGLNLGTKLKVMWELPEKPRGPITYYDVSIFDSTQQPPLLVHRQKVADTFYDWCLPDTRAHNYTVTVEAVNVNKTSEPEKIYRSGSQESQVYNYDLSPPEAISIKESGVRYADLEVVDKNENRAEALFYQIDCTWGRPIETKEKTEIELAEVPVYQPVKFWARTCVRPVSSSRTVCGHPSPDSEVNPGCNRPSSVMGLQDCSDNRKIRALPTWKESKFPIGPPQYYLVRVEEGNRVVAEINLAQSELAYALKNMPHREYRIGVAAYYEVRAANGTTKVFGDITWVTEDNFWSKLLYCLFALAYLVVIVLFCNVLRICNKVESIKREGFIPKQYYIFDLDCY